MPDYPPPPKNYEELRKFIETIASNMKQNSQNTFRDFINETYTAWYEPYKLWGLNEEIDLMMWTMDQLIKDPSLLDDLYQDTKGRRILDLVPQMFQPSPVRRIIPMTSKKDNRTYFVTMGEGTAICVREPWYPARPQWKFQTYAKPTQGRTAHPPNQATFIHCFWKTAQE
jgi:hypothetical protein